MKRNNLSNNNNRILYHLNVFLKCSLEQMVKMIILLKLWGKKEKERKNERFENSRCYLMKILIFILR